MLDNPFAFLLIFTIIMMCASALLYAFSGREIFNKVFNVSVFVFLAWIAFAMFILMFAAVQ